MRKLFIAGNWKMNLNRDECTALAEGLGKALSEAHRHADGSDCREGGCCCDVAVCPPYVYLEAVQEALGDSRIMVGAQNMYFEDNGAFTGEISAAMLKDIGCALTILGHSERRHVLKETDEMINKKVHKALAEGLQVILCIGELLEEREANKTEEVCERHLREGLKGLSAAQMAEVTIAYEPVWAIGTGKTATPAQAQDAHAFCRGVLKDMFDATVAENTRIQYGGSVKPSNAAELMQQPDVDGALVGGASLKVDDFTGILKAGCGLNQ